MRKLLAAAAAVSVSLPLLAHVTPNVVLVKRGEFLRSTLPGAIKFSEKQLMIGGPDMAAIRRATGWAPSEEEAKLYLGRDAQDGVVGTVAFVWMPSEHGPMGIGVAFDAGATITRVAVTDVGMEPLAWVRALVEAGGMSAFDGLSIDHKADPASVAPSARGAMTRYYAGVIAAAVARAQALERVDRGLSK